MEQVRHQLPPQLDEPLTHYERGGYLFQTGRDEGRQEGLVSGHRQALLASLSARGLSPTAKQRAMIESCSDPDQLLRWITAVHRVSSVRQLLAS